MIVLDVPPAAARGVHDFIAGQRGAFADLVERTRAAREGGAVGWRHRVVAATVHHVESLHRYADDAGVPLALEPDRELDERERAFLDDHLLYRTAAGAACRRRLRAGEYIAGGGEAVSALSGLWMRARPAPAVPAVLRSVVIIGAYGGDHVGDAAILGGVLLALHQRHGVVRATVMSHRHAHTRRLVAGLAVPVQTAAAEYRLPRMARLLDDCDALVLAGGPLVDLPRVLAKHLAAAHAARSRGLPFLVERVGIGEFRHRLSLLAARRTLRLASAVSVRSAASAEHPLVRDLRIDVGRDPAFDYLATRRELDRLRADERATVASSLTDAGDDLVIGVNLRPVDAGWHPLGAAHGARVVDGFMTAFARGLELFAAAAPRRTTFVFFPMNPIQFGMSDLTAAYRLHTIVGGRVRLRVWEADPDVDGVLHLMRHLDAAVVMRLHAAIFAQSQQVPVLGVDFFADRNSKLTQLFQDQRRAEDVCGMEAFGAEWLAQRLASAIGDGFARRIAVADR